MDGDTTDVEEKHASTPPVHHESSSRDLENCQFKSFLPKNFVIAPTLPLNRLQETLSEVIILLRRSELSRSHLMAEKGGVHAVYSKLMQQVQSLRGENSDLREHLNLVQMLSATGGGHGKKGPSLSRIRGDELHRKCVENQKLRKELDDKRESHARLRYKLAHERQDRQHEIDAQLIELDRLRTECSQLRILHDTRGRTITTLESENSRQRIEWESERQRMIDHVNELEGSRKSAVTALQSKQEEFEEQQRVSAEASARAQAAEEAARITASQLETSSKDLMAAGQLIETLHFNVERATHSDAYRVTEYYDAEMTRLTAMHEAKQRDLRQTISDMRHRLQCCEESEEKLRRVVREQGDVNVEQSTRLREQTAAMDALVAERDELRRGKESILMFTHASEAQEEVKKLKERIACLSKSETELRTQLHESEAGRRSCEVECAALRADLSSKASELASLSHGIGLLRASKAAADKRCQELSQSLDNAMRSLVPVDPSLDPMMLRGKLVAETVAAVSREKLRCADAVHEASSRCVVLELRIDECNSSLRKAWERERELRKKLQAALATSALRVSHNSLPSASPMIDKSWPGGSRVGRSDSFIAPETLTPLQTKSLVKRILGRSRRVLDLSSSSTSRGSSTSTASPHSFATMSVPVASHSPAILPEDDSCDAVIRASSGTLCGAYRQHPSPDCVRLEMPMESPSILTRLSVNTPPGLEVKSAEYAGGTDSDKENGGDSAAEDEFVEMGSSFVKLRSTRRQRSGGGSLPREGMASRKRDLSLN